MAVNIRDRFGKLLNQLPKDHPIATARLHTEYILHDHAYVIVGRARRNRSLEINVVPREQYNDSLSSNLTNP